MPVLAQRADDPQAKAKDEATTAIDSAKRALKQGDTAAVYKLLNDARASAKSAGPDVEQKFFELEFQLNLKTLDSDLAEKAAWSWMRSCGPASIDACRGKALSAVKRIPKPSAALKKRIASLKEFDACVKQAESKRAGDKPPPCAEAAQAFFKRDGDKLMVARLKLANAVSNATNTPPAESAAQLLEQAERACDEPRCLSIRRSAFKGLMRLHRASSDVDAVARAAIHDARLYASTLPVDKRLWARTPELDQACDALDGKNGAGSCRKLERELAGQYTFRDYSAKQAGEGLSPDAVREVNAHYAVSLEPCLQQQALTLAAPGSQSHEVRWTVGNDGHVTQVALGRKEEDHGPLGQCLRQQFLVWRYPRYRGELQHVEQVFVVHARERR
jgi:hypothetical protein